MKNVNTNRLLLLNLNTYSLDCLKFDFCKILKKVSNNYTIKNQLVLKQASKTVYLFIYLLNGSFACKWKQEK